MEHIRISPGKLKLMLTKADMEHYELDADGLSGDDLLSRDSLRPLLEDCRIRSGFDAVGGRLFIQLYPSRDGGAEIYITRLDAPPPDREKTDGGDAIRITAVYRFDAMASLLEVCRRLADDPAITESTAWSGERDCFLILYEKISCREYLERSKRRGGDCKKRLFIGEYGRYLPSPAAEFYVKEHCFCFCEKNAVKILANMV